VSTAASTGSRTRSAVPARPGSLLARVGTLRDKFGSSAAAACPGRSLDHIVAAPEQTTEGHCGVRVLEIMLDRFFRPFLAGSSWIVDFPPPVDCCISCTACWRPARRPCRRGHGDDPDPDRAGLPQKSILFHAQVVAIEEGNRGVLIAGGERLRGGRRGGHGRRCRSPPDRSLSRARTPVGHLSLLCCRSAAGGRAHPGSGRGGSRAGD